MSVLALAPMVTTPPDPTGIATTLADNVGNQVLDVVTGVIPVLVPFLAAFWAIRYVQGRIGLKGRP